MKPSWIRSLRKLAPIFFSILCFLASQEAHAGYVYQYNDFGSYISSNEIQIARGNEEINILNFNPQAQNFIFDTIGILIAFSGAGDQYDHVTGDMRLNIYETSDGLTPGTLVSNGIWRDISIVDHTNVYPESRWSSGIYPNEGIIHFRFPEPITLSTSTRYIISTEADNVHFTETWEGGELNQYNFGWATLYHNAYQVNQAENRSIRYSALTYPLFTEFSIGVPDIEIQDNISTNTTWIAGRFYEVSGIIEIDSGSTLTIEPGAIVQFDTATSSGIVVNGTLVANGNQGAENQIKFISNDPSPSPGDWVGITVNAGGIANISYARAQHAGKSGYSEAAFSNEGGNLSIASSTVIYSWNYGIKTDLGTTTISGSEISHNQEGIHISGGYTKITDRNIIHENSLYGIYNELITEVDARNNYWNVASGPYNASSNSLGEGDVVSDNINFDPWLHELHFISSPGKTSVDDGTIEWTGSTEYASEWSNAINTWNALGEVSIATSSFGIFPDLEISDVSNSSASWSGQWIYSEESRDTIEVNSFYAQHDSSAEIQNMLTHELGHALGLAHSFLGNVMYMFKSNQTLLSPQDIGDYYFLWN